ncbi:50S ribosomal protein L32 [Spiroplasma endosymbiont of Agriotes lineatus]|uniref:50S ribosomal protein L32 n=1 Tax=Spiroplasma endosymbiont of Agriotes lineatus TaxID=3077930 RepID=UPI0030D3BD1F
MAVPFRRTSKTRKAKRRTHFNLLHPTLVNCTNCGANIKPHRVCKECGYYKDKEAVKIVE